ncbi:MAG: LOG family protein [Alphaproteobacteria bacterium]|nr:LOG family protein [Alphaproteobacteria bacterium]
MATQKIKNRTSKKQIHVFVAGGSRLGKNPVYEQEVYELGKEIGRQNYQLSFGLSSHGIMGAVARGVRDNWSDKTRKPIRGVTTKAYLRRYDTEEELEKISEIVVAHTLEERKKELLKSEFIIFTPGGAGTLDELAFDCVAMQDGLIPVKPFVMFNVEGFFHHILEYLKEIHLKGFADFFPFIVVDDVFEASVAFEMIDIRCKKKLSNDKIQQVIEDIVYDLPYVIEKRQENPKISTAEILSQMESDLKSKDRNVVRELCRKIETTYLNSEIERMYARLEKTGRDISDVSHKLAGLKKRYKIAEKN